MRAFIFPHLILGIVFSLGFWFCFGDRANSEPADENALNALVKGEVLDCLGQKGQAAGHLEEITAPELPGIGRSISNLKVVQLKSPQGRLFRYSGLQNNEVLCGIVLYDARPETIFGFVSKLVRESSRFVEDSPPHYRLSSLSPAQIVYFGDRRARGVIGVVVLARQPSPNIPSFQFDYHAILLH